MNERKDRVDLFHRLLGAYYGEGRSATQHPASHRWLAHSADELLEGYYGRPQRRHVPKRGVPVSLASSHDDGETLKTKSRAQAVEEYVVARSLGDASGEEYVVERTPADNGIPLGMSLSEAPADPRKEYEVDLLDPLAADPDGQRSAPPAAPAAAPVVAAATSTRTMNSPQASAPSHDDFIADMQSILSGKGVYDPVAKQTVSKEAATAKSPAAATTSQAQDIFEKLAASMQYANAYDLGTVELENRFADFDMLDDAARKTEADKKKRQSAPATGKRPQVGAKDFIEDLDAIHRDRDADRAAATRSGISEASSIDPRLSRFMFDTGEHVLVAGTAYVDQLRVWARTPASRFPTAS